MDEPHVTPLSKRNGYHLQDTGIFCMDWVLAIGRTQILIFQFKLVHTFHVLRYLVKKLVAHSGPKYSYCFFLWVRSVSVVCYSIYYLNNVLGSLCFFMSLIPYNPYLLSYFHIYTVTNNIRFGRIWREYNLSLCILSQ